MKTLIFIIFVFCIIVIIQFYKRNEVISIDSVNSPLSYTKETLMIVEGERDNLEVYYTNLGVEENWPEINEDVSYLYRESDFGKY